MTLSELQKYPASYEYLVSIVVRFCPMACFSTCAWGRVVHPRRAALPGVDVLTSLLFVGGYGAHSRKSHDRCIWRRADRYLSSGGCPSYKQPGFSRATDILFTLIPEQGNYIHTMLRDNHPEHYLWHTRHALFTRSPFTVYICLCLSYLPPILKQFNSVILSRSLWGRPPVKGSERDPEVSTTRSCHT